MNIKIMRATNTCNPGPSIRANWGIGWRDNPTFIFH